MVKGEWYSAIMPVCPFWRDGKERFLFPLNLCLVYLSTPIWGTPRMRMELKGRVLPAVLFFSNPKLL